MGSRIHQETIGKEEEYLTPKYILDALGPFDLDPCASSIQPWPTALKCYTIDDDGLSKDWVGRVWLNPPFTRGIRELWMERMAAHRNGVMLIPAACETRAFAAYVWQKAAGLLMLDHRPYFCKTDGSRHRSNCGGTVCLIAYGVHNLQALQRSKLGPVLKEI